MTRDFEGSQLLFIFTDRLTLFRNSHFSPSASATERMHVPHLQGSGAKFGCEIGHMYQEYSLNMPLASFP